VKIDDDDLDLLARAERAGLLSDERGDEAVLMPEGEQFVRLTLAQRIQHVLMFTSFFILVLTGLPLMFPDAPLLHRLFFFPSAFWLRCVIHRVAGIILMGVGAFQIVYVILSPRGNSDFLKIIPTARDIKDAFGLFLYNLGMRDEKPGFGKFNFIEKFEYWALAWGICVMAITGLMLWFQEVTLALLPMWAFDIVRIIHGFEAILAFLAIIIWHMYNVHLNPDVFPMSKVWITGKISKKELMDHHPLEYEEILRERREKLQTEKIRSLLDEVRRGGSSAGSDE